MIKIFEDPTTVIFSSNGDKILQPTYASVHCEDNGDYYLEMDLPLDYINFVASGAIIVSPTPDGDQAFRIRSVIKTKNKIKIKAPHVYYDADNYLILDSNVVSQDCDTALDHLNTAASPTSTFTTYSDVGTVDSFRCVRKSLSEAVATVIERWGGHIYRDNFAIRVLTTVGEDRGVTIRYAKNLRDIQADEEWGEVVTKIFPVGYDGITLPEQYLESEVQYSIPYCKTISFDQDINRDDYIDAEGELDEAAYLTALENDLRQRALNYLAVNSLPHINYTLSSNVDNVRGIGDVIEVIDERIGVNILTNVISYDYDPIAGKYRQLEFGNFQQKLQGLMNTITAETTTQVNEKTQEVKAVLSDELNQATAQIWSTLGNSYVIYEGDKILVVDTLPKEDATNVIMINNGGIGFSNTGINGTFSSAWTIDGTLNMQNINVINLVADLIKGGTLRLGTVGNAAGLLELYDENNALIGEMNKDGLKMYGADGSYVLMNNTVGFAGFDRQNNKIYWVSQDEFHMAKSVVENEIALCNKMRFIPITIYEQDGVTIKNDGIALVSTL